MGGWSSSIQDARKRQTWRDEHIFIRPGGDVFLLLGMVHTLFAEKLVHLGRLAEHVAGVELLESAVAGFAAEKVSARCGIPAETIRTLARTLAARNMPSCMDASAPAHRSTERCVVG